MRRVPGIKTVDVPRVADVGLPPMDIAVFVGFAERGPLHRPVLLQDASQYARVFGGALELVRADDGTVCLAHLNAAVNTFFAGGGRSCYVIRVAGGPKAGKAVTARLQVPGVSVVWRAQAGGPWIGNTQVRLRASSPGAWADRSEVSARLRSVPAQTNSLVAAGEVLRISSSTLGSVGYLRVSKSGNAQGSLDAELAAGAVCWRARPPSPSVASREPWLIERLSVDLAVRQPSADALSSGARRWQRDDCGLAFGTGKTLPWFESDLAERFDAGLGMPDSDWPCAGMLSAEVVGAEGSLESVPAEWMIIPDGLGAFFETWQAAEIGTGDALERNGLAVFEAELFVDPAWSSDLYGDLLLNWADHVRFLGASPRALKGLHALLGFQDSKVRDATWIAVPDAGHTGWEMDEALQVANGFLTLQADPPCDCEPAVFGRCEPPPPRPPAAPELTLPKVIPAEVEWNLYLQPAPDAGAAEGSTNAIVRVEVEIAASADFSDRRPLPLGLAPGAELPNPREEIPAWAFVVPTKVALRLPVGVYFMRARTWRSLKFLRSQQDGTTREVVSVLASAWSQPSMTITRSETRQLLPAPKVDEASVAFQVHAALLDLASASREHFALLSAPSTWKEADLAEHVRLLRQRVERRQDSAQALSFAAIHHPWLTQIDWDGRVWGRPPEGALLAQYASRTRAKGCWVAPGLDTLILTKGLESTLDPSALEASGCNPIESRPRGISATGAATLATDADWSAIGVRCLFILLRKLVRREGERFAFEPNDQSQRRSLEHTFNELLRRLLQAGALRGARAEEAYQLRTASGTELQREIERGQCSLEVRVAPSRPLRFLTLYAVRSAEQLRLEERI